TTWTQEAVWLIGNDIDFCGAEISIMERFPFFEICALTNIDKEAYINHTNIDTVKNSLNYIKNLKGKRFIKTHLPFSLLPQQIQNGDKTPKIIYVIRNPKDICVSYFHHGRVFHDWTPNLNDFAEVFLEDKVLYGSYWKHVKGYWDKRFNENILIIFYEDMIKDLLTVVKEIAQFLNKTISEDKMLQLLEHLNFKSMKKNKSVNYEDIIQYRTKQKLIGDGECFMRSGVSGKHKEEMSAPLIQKFSKWIMDNITGTSLEDHPVISNCK
ncbi:hypothetical protein FQA39_LY04913, partial [Lamprigera yunnana]